ncbi:BH0509 family protein [Peribacillus muralis]|nr:BH0509 family protein [Peribacillus muralis]
MSDQERATMIEWLAMTGYSKQYYEKMSDKELEFYYREMLEENNGENQQ